jgi:hypothetical protein
VFKKPTGNKLFLPKIKLMFLRVAIVSSLMANFIGSMISIIIVGGNESCKSKRERNIINEVRIHRPLVFVHLLILFVLKVVQ